MTTGGRLASPRQVGEHDDTDGFTPGRESAPTMSRPLHLTPYLQLLGLLLGLLLLPESARAFALSVDARLPYQSITPWLQECLSPSAAETPDQLDVATCRQGGFSRVDPAGISHGFTTDTLWLRLVLQNPADAPVQTHLEIGFPQLDDVRLLWRHDSQWRSERNGDHIPVDERVVATRLPGFLVQLAPRETRELYLRVHSSSALSVPVAAASPMALLQRQDRKSIRSGTFYGISAAVILMALIFYLLLRETVFLHYLLLVFSMSGVMLCLDGIGLLVWHDLPYWQQYAIIHFEVLAGVFGILFARQFLRANATPAVFTHLYRALLLWFGAAAAASTVIPFEHYVLATAGGCLLLIPVLFCHGLVLALRRDVPAIVFTAGTSGFFVAGALAFINNLGYAHQMDMSVEYMRSSFGIVMLVLSLSLGWRIYGMKEARLAAEAAAQAALDLGKARSEFLARMSHELRTPMNGVLGIAELLRDTPMTPMQRSYIATLQDSGRHLLDVINDILDFSKLSEGKVQLRQEVFSLRDLADDIHSIFALQAEHRGLQYSVTGTATSQLLVGDPTWLRQILINLVGNAFKFTEQGRIAVTIDMTPAGYHRQDIRIEVSDTGAGMAPADRDKLFQPFSQLESSAQHHREGTGLGLAICRQLVDLMGGAISVESAPGQGSRFRVTLTLPEADATATVALPAADSEALDERLLAGRHVLVAEDNPTNRLILEKILGKFGMVTTSARDGAEAVALYCAPDARFDLVLMDCEMPVLKGPEATRHIRDYDARLGRSTVPIIALTAHTAPELVEGFLRAGMTDHLGKPYSQDMLRRVLQQHLQDISQTAS